MQFIVSTSSPKVNISQPNKWLHLLHLFPASHGHFTHSPFHFIFHLFMQKLSGHILVLHPRPSHPIPGRFQASLHTVLMHIGIG